MTPSSLIPLFDNDFYQIQLLHIKPHLICSFFKANHQLYRSQAKGSLKRNRIVEKPSLSEFQIKTEPLPDFI